MKKIFIFLFAFVFALSSSGSTQESNLSVENGTIKFQDINTYALYADEAGRRSQIETLASSSEEVTTLLEAGDTTEALPDFIKLIVNRDYIFTVGNYLLKFDMEGNRLLTIDKNTNGAYTACGTTIQRKPA